MNIAERAIESMCGFRQATDRVSGRRSRKYRCANVNIVTIVTIFGGIARTGALSDQMLR